MSIISGINQYGTTEIALEKGCAESTVRLHVRELRHDGKLSPGRGKGRNDLFSAEEKQLIIEDIGKSRRLYGKYSKRNKK